MSTTILVSYLARPIHGKPSGLRVWTDGRVEAHGESADWKAATQLGPSQLQQLQALVRQSGIFALPDQVPAPPGMRDGMACEWYAAIDSHTAQVVVHGWGDENPAARSLRALVMEMYSLIAAAQTGHAV